MTITDICRQLGHLQNDQVIFAERKDGEFTPDSEAALRDAGVPAQEVGSALEYCLEVSIARDAVQVWSRWRDGAQPNERERAEAVCYKANNDAWGPPNFLPNSDGNAFG